ncbi:YybS family protein [Wukongibacter sp. M2B1]|uniref:YybS family protein n=1 Tax=Wukongibacter sp. M2B1 TaxID=3088895 RepID=UPI003D7A328A
MDKRNKTRAMVESALITTIAVIFALASMYIPFISVLSALMPVPFIIIGVKNGLKYTVLSLVSATIIIGIFAGPLRVILILASSWLVSIALAYMIRKRYSFKSIIFFGSVASIVSLIISLALMPMVVGVGLLDMIEQSFNSAMEMYTELFKQYGIDNEKSKQAMDSLKLTKDLILIVFPSAMVMASVITTYINYSVSGVILRKIGFSIEKRNKFSHLKLPANFMMGALIIVILTYFANSFNIIKSDALNANVIYLFQYVFIILGLAVVSFFLEKRKIGNTLRRMILIFILFIPSLNLILFFMGILDSIFNIRKLGT